MKTEKGKDGTEIEYPTFEDAPAKEYEVYAVVDIPLALGFRHFGEFDMNYILPTDEFLSLNGEHDVMRTLVDVEDGKEEALRTWLKDYTKSVNPDLDYKSKDALTGVRNKLAYIDFLKSIEYRSENGTLKEYGVIVFDLNDLKKVNDNKGHAEGDEYIKSACKMICQRFKHSPVFRIGGDEFVVILEGEDYESRDSLIQAFEYEVEENQKNGLVVVSSGLDVFNPDIEEDYNDVFKRADKKMYERKKLLKEMKSI
jgi:diguanylate cyclase (GGDEF)-like protein